MLRAGFILITRQRVLSLGLMVVSWIQISAWADCPLGPVQRRQVSSRLVEAANQYAWPDSVRQVIAEYAGFDSWEMWTRFLETNEESGRRASVSVEALSAEEAANSWEAYFQRHLRSLRASGLEGSQFQTDGKGRIIEWQAGRGGNGHARLFYDSIGNVSAIEFEGGPHARSLRVDDFARIDMVLKLLNSKFLVYRSLHPL